MWRELRANDIFDGSSPSCFSWKHKQQQKKKRVVRVFAHVLTLVHNENQCSSHSPFLSSGFITPFNSFIYVIYKFEYSFMRIPF